MTLFTAEGLADALPPAGNLDISTARDALRGAYLRWLRTQQGHPKPPNIPAVGAFNLIGLKSLWSRRAPGRTCLSALEAGAWGTTGNRINDSKGCGGVMRVAPIGLLASRIGDLDAVFTLAAEAAAMTHGHPSGYLSAGAFASILAALAGGNDLLAAVHSTLICLSRWTDHRETSKALTAAIDLAAEGKPSISRIESLGGAWVGEEALAIGVYCALVSSSLQEGVVLAVNHSGDSDSTGSIAGNILGAALGRGAIPAHWLEQLELRDVIEQVAADLVMGFEETDEWWRRYPGC
jgi:ADP-ribosylglycohydrolase